jgi:hypothetical protein
LARNQTQAQSTDWRQFLGGFVLWFIQVLGGPPLGHVELAGHFIATTTPSPSKQANYFCWKLGRTRLLDNIDQGACSCSALCSGHKPAQRPDSGCNLIPKSICNPPLPSSQQMVMEPSADFLEARDRAEGRENSPSALGPGSTLLGLCTVGVCFFNPNPEPTTHSTQT